MGETLLGRNSLWAKPADTSKSSVAKAVSFVGKLKGCVPFLQYMYNYRVTVRSVFCCTESKMMLAKGSVSSQCPLSVGVKGR